MSPHSTSPAPHDHRHLLNPWVLGAAGVTAALVLSPYLLPLLGVGEAGTAEDIMHYIGGHREAGSFGTGLAGSLQAGIAQLPLIGGALTSGTLVELPFLGVSVASGILVTAGTSLLIGAGGLWLANWMEKRETDADSIRWSRVVRTAALATSLLISLPSLLTAISVGITFLATLVRPLWGSYAAHYAQQTLGGISMNMGPVGGIAAVLPHLFEHSAPLVPLLFAPFLGKHAQAAHPANDDSAPQAVELVAATPIVKDQPCHIAFRLRDAASGKSLSPDDIHTVHTKKLHTMLVDRTLNEYHHIHPVYDAATGLFTCDFTPRTQQPFTVWNEFTPVGQEAPTRSRSVLPAARGIALAPRITPVHHASAGGLSAFITANPPLTSGRASTLRVQLREADGSPVSGLAPVMGEYAHLAGFSADGRHFIHSHPLTPLSAPVENGVLAFHIAPEQAGLSKFFLQINHQGREVVIPFGQAIAQAQSFRAQVAAPAHATGHAHGSYAMG